MSASMCFFIAFNKLIWKTYLYEKYFIYDKRRSLMNLGDFTVLFIQAIRLFAFEERTLFTTYGDALREEAISHQLARKLGYIFRNFDVDCEYSRQPGGDEKINDDGKINRPDIIIHSRGNNDNNLAIIEIKWVKNKGDDVDKVKKFKHLNYGYGVVVRFDEIGNVAEFKVYDYANDGLYDQLELYMNERIR